MRRKPANGMHVALAARLRSLEQQLRYECEDLFERQDELEQTSQEFDDQVNELLAGLHKKFNSNTQHVQTNEDSCEKIVSHLIAQAQSYAETLRPRCGGLVPPWTSRMLRASGATSVTSSGKVPQKIQEAKGAESPTAGAGPAPQSSEHAQEMLRVAQPVPSQTRLLAASVPPPCPLGRARSLRRCQRRRCMLGARVARSSTLLADLCARVRSRGSETAMSPRA